jgi:oligogalacturonide lyase
VALPLSRREFLALAAVGALSPPEWKRYPDPATELEVIRLTDPAFSSGMTAPHLRQFSRHSDTLLAWSERTGTRQAFLTNLKTGESIQLTDAKELEPATLCLTPDERSFWFFDGPELHESSLTKPAPRQIYRIPDGALRVGFTTASDGSVLFGERTAGRTQVMRVSHGQPRKMFEPDGEITDLMVRPGNVRARLQLVWRQSGALWASAMDGGGRKPLKLEPGQTGEVLWTPTGRTLIYLHIPDGPKELITLRENNPDTGADTLLAKTSQFISAAPNADASVFVAASRSLASPYVLITLRAVRRELTLCEHHASDPAMVNPVFTPDSRSILFVSDRHGKPAIYLMPVARFVEETATEDEPPADPRGSHRQ